MKHIAESTVRRLSAYLRYLEDFETRGLMTISSEELANRGGTTSAQVQVTSLGTSGSWQLDDVYLDPCVAKLG